MSWEDTIKLSKFIEEDYINAWEKKSSDFPNSREKVRLLYILDLINDEAETALEDELSEDELKERLKKIVKLTDAINHFRI
tara:strand:- start:327 stop:569 length:243 start_codon:yes stop_codon:yes gene_type:complete